jgi:hypothetical protein
VAAGEHDSGGSLGFAKRIFMPKLLVTGHGVDSNHWRLFAPFTAALWNIHFTKAFYIKKIFL